MTAAASFRVRTTQRGIVLPLVLVMLLVLTIASLAIVEQIGSQTHLAANAAVGEQTLQVAEAVLREAAGQLSAGSYSQAQFNANANGLYNHASGLYGSANPAPFGATSNAWGSAIALAPINTADLTSERKFIIERLPDAAGPGSAANNANSYGSATEPPQVYRISVRVIGQARQGMVQLQGLYQL
jgi:Tfp pilus assembly protein PilX